MSVFLHFLFTHLIYYTLGVQACRQFYTVRYTRLPNLLEEFKIAKHQADGSYTKLMKKLIKVDLLILDEWLLYDLTDEEATLLLEIINARYEAQKSNIYCSQFDFKGWYEKLGDGVYGTLAEAILDRIIHQGSRNIIFEYFSNNENSQ
ncbi:ATP-binding protein [Fundicoccus sp. Sow4_D5]|uniref:ATP-binding protein n=1 Tax=Fundicoccus sp. Sow4_D5 TaxID=3438782 RepID=UPI003F8E8B81